MDTDVTFENNDILFDICIKILLKKFKKKLLKRLQKVRIQIIMFLKLKRTIKKTAQDQKEAQLTRRN